MSAIEQAGSYTLGDRQVWRLGYGAMQLAGPGVFGPPRDRQQALAVLRAAVEAGVDHIDTSDFYGPNITNQLIREALAPYRHDLTLVTKVGARRDSKGGWLPAFSAQELTQAVHDNLTNLGVDQLYAVNLRMMIDPGKPAEGSLAEPLETLAELQRHGLIRHIGLSNVTANQVAEARQICPIVCVQNHYNLVQRQDDALVNALAKEGIAFVPFFPLGGFSPLQSDLLSRLADELNVTPMQLALAWLLRRSPNILLIPGTSSPVHLAQNLEVADIELDQEIMEQLDALAVR